MPRSKVKLKRNSTAKAVQHTAGICKSQGLSGAAPKRYRPLPPKFLSAAQEIIAGADIDTTDRVNFVMACSAHLSRKRGLYGEELMRAVVREMRKDRDRQIKKTVRHRAAPSSIAPRAETGDTE